MDKTNRITINAAKAGQRLDVFLTNQYPEFSRSYFNKASKKGFILINDNPVKSGYILKEKDSVTVIFHREQIDLEPADIPLNIVHEDDEIIVINKTAGMAVHPGKGSEGDTLVNALLHHTKKLSEFGESDRPGIVHRLDKFTSGLLVIAKTDKAMRHLRNQFDTRSIHRIYWSLVWGKLAEEEGTVDTLIDRSRKDPTKFVVARTGKTAVTHWKMLQNFEYATLLEIKLDTGRTHQIRVHMNYLHHPVVGDGDYNGRDSQLKGLPVNLQRRGKHILKILSHQALHAKKLSFLHPAKNERVTFEIDLPADMRSVLDKLPDFFLLD